MENKNHKHALYFVLFLTVIFVVFGSSLAFQQIFYSLTETLKSFVSSHEFFGQFVFVIFSSLSVLLGPFTSVPLVPSAVIIWGPLHTFALLITGWLLGNSLAYFGGKYLGKYLVSKILGQQKLDSWVQVLEKRLNFLHLLLFRVATPSETGYIFGILNYSFKKYLALTLIAELPFAYITVYASQAFAETGWKTFIYLGVLWVAIIYFAATQFQKKVQEN